MTATTRVLGLDPGRASLFVAAGGSMDTLDVIKCSNSRWREISGAHHGLQKRRNWNRKNHSLVVALTSGPSPKVTTSAEYSEYLRHVISIRDQALGFSGTRSGEG